MSVEEYWRWNAVTTKKNGSTSTNRSANVIELDEVPYSFCAVRC